jgi:SpoVK/Ycf46/Vps4 family AAA+-type ATPase
MLDIYLGKRPLADDVDLDALADRLEGFSGADIKYICDRSATIPFLSSVATGQEGRITQAILDDVASAAPKTVTPDMLRRFEVWGKEAATA